MKPDDLKELLDTVSAKVRKETAACIIRRIKRDYGLIGIINILDDIAKEYGVEVEENERT